jgi:glycosyltransferase involved in cell wall biosynthesis
MILGFHYHIPFAVYNGNYYVPGHFGLFIEEIAKNVKKLKLFLFKREIFDSTFFDYRISEPNIEVFEVSKEKPAYIKHFYARKFVSIILKDLVLCDYLLLRGPSPMNYAFSERFDKAKITNLIVGDYSEGIKYLQQPFYRIGAVKLLNYLMDKSYVKSLIGTKICCNSEVLHEKYKHLSKRNTIINTGNIKSTDIEIIERPHLLLKPKIKLFYVGRIDWAKGFKEMLECLVELNNNKKQIFELNIVGWDETKGELVKKAVLKLAKELNINSNIIFHGKKKPGKELYQFYKDADIFILASYQEGFPRTIWEAFANGLPVVTTPVGSISLKLNNRQHALFCEVKSSISLYKSILEIIQNYELMKTCIDNGYSIVKENTIENQLKKLVNYIHND